MALRIFKALDEGGISALWSDIVLEVGKGVQQVQTWANSTFVKSVNGKTGSSITLTKSDIGLGNVDNTADANKHVASADSATDSTKLGGKVASDYMLKDDHEQFELVTADALNDLEHRKVNKSQKIAGVDLQDDISKAALLDALNVEDGAQKHIAPTKTEITNALGNEYVVTCDKDAVNLTYTLKQNGAEVVKINIPKDKVVSEGKCVSGTWGADGKFTESASGTDHALKLTIANQEDPIYINTQDLVDIYTYQKNATKIQLNIDANNEISATIVPDAVGNTELADDAVTTTKIKNLNVTTAKIDTNAVTEGKIATDAVTTDKIKDGNVTKDKLAEAVRTSLGLADNSVQKPTSPTEDHVMVFDANGNAKDSGKTIGNTYTFSGGTDKFIVTPSGEDPTEYAIAVTKVNGHSVETDVPANAVFTDTDTKVTAVGNHYAPEADANAKINADRSSTYIRDTERDISFIGAIIRDEKGHVVGGDTYAVQALTDAEIHDIIVEASNTIAAQQSQS